MFIFNVSSDPVKDRESEQEDNFVSAESKSVEEREEEGKLFTSEETENEGDESDESETDLDKKLEKYATKKDLRYEQHANFLSIFENSIAEDENLFHKSKKEKSGRHSSGQLKDQKNKSNKVENNSLSYSHKKSQSDSRNRPNAFKQSLKGADEGSPKSVLPNSSSLPNEHERKNKIRDGHFKNSESRKEMKDTKTSQKQTKLTDKESHSTQHLEHERQRISKERKRNPQPSKSDKITERKKEVEFQATQRVVKHTGSQDGLLDVEEPQDDGPRLSNFDFDGDLFPSELKFKQSMKMPKEKKNEYWKLLEEGLDSGELKANDTPKNKEVAPQIVKDGKVPPQSSKDKIKPKPKNVTEAIRDFTEYLEENFEDYDRILDVKNGLLKEFRDILPDWNKENIASEIGLLYKNSDEGKNEKVKGQLIEKVGSLIVPPQIIKIAEDKDDSLLKSYTDMFGKGFSLKEPESEVNILSQSTTLVQFRKDTNEKLGKIIELLKKYPDDYFNLTILFSNTRRDIDGNLLELKSTSKEKIEKIEKLFKGNLEGYVKDIVAEFFDFTQCGVDKNKRIKLGNRVPNCDGNEPKGWAPIIDDWSAYRNELKSKDVFSEREIRTILLNKLEKFKNVELEELIKEGEKSFVDKFKYEDTKPLKESLSFIKKELENLKSGGKEKTFSDISKSENPRIINIGVIDVNNQIKEDAEEIKNKSEKELIKKRIEEFLENGHQKNLDIQKRKRNLGWILDLLEFYNKIEEEVEKKMEEDKRKEEKKRKKKKKKKKEEFEEEKKEEKSEDANRELVEETNKVLIERIKGFYESYALTKEEADDANEIWSYITIILKFKNSGKYLKELLNDRMKKLLSKNFITKIENLLETADQKNPAIKKRKRNLKWMLDFLKFYNNIEQEVEKKMEKKKRKEEEKKEEKKRKKEEEKNEEMRKKQNKKEEKNEEKTEEANKKLVEETNKVLIERIGEFYKAYHNLKDEEINDANEIWKNMPKILLTYINSGKYIKYLLKERMEILKLEEEKMAQKKTLETILQFINYYKKNVKKFEKFVENKVKPKLVDITTQYKRLRLYSGMNDAIEMLYRGTYRLALSSEQTLKGLWDNTENKKKERVEKLKDKINKKDIYDKIAKISTKHGLNEQEKIEKKEDKKNHGYIKFSEYLKKINELEEKLNKKYKEENSSKKKNGLEKDLEELKELETPLNEIDVLEKELSKIKELQKDLLDSDKFYKNTISGYLKRMEKEERKIDNKNILDESFDSKGSSFGSTSSSSLGFTSSDSESTNSSFNGKSLSPSKSNSGSPRRWKLPFISCRSKRQTEVVENVVKKIEEENQNEVKIYSKIKKTMEENKEKVLKVFEEIKELTASFIEKDKAFKENLETRNGGNEEKDFLNFEKCKKQDSVPEDMPSLVREILEEKHF